MRILLSAAAGGAIALLVTLFFEGPIFGAFECVVTVPCGLILGAVAGALNKGE